MEPHPEWVHFFCHTLDIIPVDWSLETELYHGTIEWGVLREGFMRKFIFEDGFKSIDEALQELKTVIFQILQDPLELIQPDWST